MKLTLNQIYYRIARVSYESERCKLKKSYNKKYKLETFFQTFDRVVDI